MAGKDIIRQRNLILFILICVFYCIQVTINIFIEGLTSVIPLVYLFLLFALILIYLLYKNVNSKITMYVMISCIYIYFYFLIKDSPYLVNYLFMLLTLPLSAIYQNFRVIAISSIALIALTFYSFYFLNQPIFSNFGEEDFVYVILFGVFCTIFLFIFIYGIRDSNEKLQKLAYHDPLTSVANRLLLKEKFTQLQHPKTNSIAILFIDMNDFKKINDTYGHEAGDQLLVNIVSRISGVLRETDLLCRLGGDEFVILSSNIDDVILEQISSRIQQSLEKPVILNDQTIHMSASIGWHYTTEVMNASLEQMISKADLSMYRAKGSELIVSHTSESVKK